MTYKEKMEKEHPTVDNNFVLFACPGHYFDGGPVASRCPKNSDPGASCVNCWYTEIPEVELSEKTDVKKLADRVKALYSAFRDEGLNDHEALEITKIIIAEEIRNHDFPLL